MSCTATFHLTTLTHKQKEGSFFFLPAQPHLMFGLLCERHNHAVVPADHNLPCVSSKLLHPCVDFLVKLCCCLL